MIELKFAAFLLVERIHEAKADLNFAKENANETAQRNASERWTEAAAKRRKFWELLEECVRVAEVDGDSSAAELRALVADLRK